MNFCKDSICCTFLPIIGVLSFTYYTSLRSVTENNQRILIESLKTDVIKNKTDINITKKIESVDCHTVTNKLNAAKVNADDPELLQLIRDCYIESPSGLRYNLSQPEVSDPSQGQAAFVDATLNHTERGFYVDCGAHAGEEFSNSLFFERNRHWNGILIEANPSIYDELRMKHRKAFTLNACVNSNPYPSAVTFLKHSLIGTIVQNISRSGEYVQVQCFPLHSILLALNRTTVDYLSLDIEGAEKGVLDSIPWGKLEIKTISIEYDKWFGGKDSLMAYMERKGYQYLTEIKGMAAADIVVIKEGLKYL